MSALRAAAPRVRRELRKLAVALGVLIAVAGPASAASKDETNVTVAAGARGDWSMIKDLSVYVEVYDKDFKRIASVTWEGWHDAPGRKSSGSRLDRIVSDFTVEVVIVYKGSVLFNKNFEVHLRRGEPGHGIEVEFDGQKVELGSAGSKCEWPEIRITRVVDGKTVEATFKPVVMIEGQGSSVPLKATGFLCSVLGTIKVRERNGTCEARFEAEVIKRLPASTLAALLAPPCLAATTLAAHVPPLLLSPKQLRVHVCVGSRIPDGSGAWARVILETPKGRFEFDTKERTGGDLVLPPEPFHVRVELYEGRELRAAYEYEIKPGRAVVNPLGPKYLEVRIAPKRVPQVPGVRVAGASYTRTTRRPRPTWSQPSS